MHKKFILNVKKSKLSVKEETTVIDNDILKKLSAYSTPELCDGAGVGNYRTMAARIKRAVTDEKIAGTAFTVYVPFGGGGIVPDAIMAANEGDVIVISIEKPMNRAVWGDHRSLCASMKGIKGAVIDGAFRDIEGCVEVGFPIFAVDVTPGGGGKTREGNLNVPIICGDIEVCPGDYIIGDENGIIVIKPHEAEEILKNAELKKKAEAATIKKIKETGEIIPRISMDLV